MFNLEKATQISTNIFLKNSVDSKGDGVYHSPTQTNGEFIMTTIQVDTKFLDQLQVHTRILSYLYQRGFWLISPNTFSNGEFTLTFENSSRVVLRDNKGELFGIFTRPKDAIRKINNTTKGENK